MKLENKVAIVTGGAMGNGLGIVKTFLKNGAKVIIFDYSEKKRYLHRFLFVFIFFFLFFL